MNYYKQGDAAKADKIKAAFEKLGYDVSGFDMCNDNILFFTYKLQGGGKVISTTNANLYTANIIKTHPDYKELELPVEPKFKVGDWVVKKDGTTFYGGNYAEQITIIESEEWDKRIWFSSTTWLQENDIRLWTIQDAKDGDVLVTTKIRSCPFIYRKTNYNNNLAYYYAGIDGNGDFCEGCLKRTLCHFGSVSDVIPATKEQRDLLFSKMKEEGYEWDVDKKELRKIIEPKFKVGDRVIYGGKERTITFMDDHFYDFDGGCAGCRIELQDELLSPAPNPHYDIANFKPFDKVLVRDADDGKWRCNWFSHYSGEGGVYRFVTTKCGYAQCIPFEGNEHLLGTTDPCDEQYINW